MLTEPFAYWGSDPDVVRGGKGQVRISLAQNDRKEIFSHKLNYIGDNQIDGEHSGISFRFVGSDPSSNSPRFRMNIEVHAAATLGQGPLDICIDDSCLPFDGAVNSYEFVVSEPQLLHLKTQRDLSYVVLKSVSWGAP